MRLGPQRPHRRRSLTPVRALPVRADPSGLLRAAAVSWWHKQGLPETKTDHENTKAGEHEKEMQCTKQGQEIHHSCLFRVLLLSCFRDCIQGKAGFSTEQDRTFCLQGSRGPVPILLGPLK